MTTFLKLVAQTKPARERKGTLLKELNDPVKTATFALLVFVLALTSIITMKDRRPRQNFPRVRRGRQLSWS
jgi:hypothetical protein